MTVSDAQIFNSQIGATSKDAFSTNGQLNVGGGNNKIFPLLRQSILNPSNTRIFQLTSSGSIDASVNFTGYSSGYSGSASIAVQSTGKVVAAFSTWISQFTRTFNLLRFNLDGSIDATFTAPSWSGVYEETAIAIESNDDILVAGTFGNGYDLLRFNGINGSSKSISARIGPDGVTGIRCVAVAPDGKIYVGGYFSGSTGSYLIRLNSNGTKDTSFAPSINGGVHAFCLQPSDGKLIIVGNFNLVNGAHRFKTARLNTDGTLDTTFNPPTSGFPEMQAVSLSNDNKPIIVLKAFNKDSSSYSSSAIRLNADGSLDSSFFLGNTSSAMHGPNNPAGSDAIALANGKILVGGSFDHIGGHRSAIIARLHSDGYPDFDYVGSLSTGSLSNSLSTDHAVKFAKKSDGSIVVVTNEVSFSGQNHILGLSSGHAGSVSSIEASGGLSYRSLPTLPLKVVVRSSTDTSDIYVGPENVGVLTVINEGLGYPRIWLTVGNESGIAVGSIAYFQYNIGSTPSGFFSNTVNIRTAVGLCFRTVGSVAALMKIGPSEWVAFGDLIYGDWTAP